MDTLRHSFWSLAITSVSLSLNSVSLFQVTVTDFALLLQNFGNQPMKDSRCRILCFPVIETVSVRKHLERCTITYSKSNTALMSRKNVYVTILNETYKITLRIWSCNDNTQARPRLSVGILFWSRLWKFRSTKLVKRICTFFRHKMFLHCRFCCHVPLVACIPYFVVIYSVERFNVVTYSYINLY